MTRWILWYLLARITGSPIASLLVLVAAWWVADRFTVGVLPDPVRALRWWGRIRRLRRTVAHNPHDRRARLELADLLVERRRSREAVEVLRPNLEAGDDDVFTLFTMGTACARAGYHDQGEVFLSEARKLEPGFRLGQIDLELGRMRLGRKDATGARAALETFLALRPSSVEGKVLLARALAEQGDAASARRARDEAWRDYAAAPRFQRRRERLWAWRAQPWRPAFYAALAILAGLLLARGLAPVVAHFQEAAPHGPEQDPQGRSPLEWDDPSRPAPTGE
jgi:tetratricopeptide (TPR) repeat protein